MEIITITEAKKQNLKYYFTGIPCKKGHLSKRAVHNRTCYVCKCESRTKSDTKDKVKIRGKKYYKNNKEKCKVRLSEWQNNNRGHYNYLLSKYRAKKLQATVNWANLDKVKEFYKNCPKGYEVDHIIPLQNKLVCGLHNEFNLQYLTVSENRTKNNSFTPYGF